MDTTAKPRLLDLYCCQGGASMGYHQAGFDVFGVDINPQPRYPFPFHLGDALEVLTNDTFMAGFDAIHASPPCQDHSALKATSGLHGTGHLLEATLEALRAQDKPWIVENVPGAPMPGALTLCGTEFGLGIEHQGRRYRLRRHRLFLAQFHLMGAGGCMHGTDPVVGVYGDHLRSRGHYRKGADFPGEDKVALGGQALGIGWMTWKGLSQSIPPAYTQFLGEQLLAVL